MKYSEIRANNPLYLGLKNPPFFVPRYDILQPEDFAPAIKVAMADAKKALRKIGSSKSEPTFQNTVEAIDKACETINYFHKVFSNLILFRRTPELEAIEEKVEKSIAAFWSEIYQDRDFYQRVAKVKRNSETTRLSNQQNILTEKVHKSFCDAGANLPALKRKKVAAIDQLLATLKASYGKENKAYIEKNYTLVKDERLLEGLPPERIKKAREVAEKKGFKDSWVITGDVDTWLDAVVNAKSRELRRLLYKPDDGTDRLGIILKQMILLRQERAKLFGYKTYFSYKNDGSMIGDDRELKSLLDQFREQARPVVHTENRQINAFARSKDLPKSERLPRLERHDRYHYEEKYKRLKLGFNDASLKPYLNYERVSGTVFEILGNIFDVEFRLNKDVMTWHEDVDTYDVYDKADGSLRGRVCLDMFARPQKTEGAWCESITAHGTFGEEKCLPYIVIGCNITRAANKKDSQLTLLDVATYFHEMGHGFHCLMGETDYQSLSGFNNVPLDAVEFPSQILENLIYEPHVIDKYARHEDTGETLSEEIKENIKHMRAFLGGNAIRFALEITYLDMLLHARSLKKIDLTKFEVDRLAELFPGRSKQYVIAPIFEHIAIHGYDAGYHAYFWTEIMEAKAYSKLDPANDDFPQMLESLKAVYKAACLQKPQDLLAPLIGNIKDDLDTIPLMERYGLAGFVPHYNQIEQQPANDSTPPVNREKTARSQVRPSSKPS